MGSGRMKAFGFSVSGLQSSVFRPPHGDGNGTPGAGNCIRKTVDGRLLTTIYAKPSR
jgi:hypothetical protein